ncbi:MAG: Asp-tRNA(Asn)/Glu-tRNA(Gln) amidotransferase subunit GatC [Planctomycetota bacterium]|jgi:aspartyl-tRNA(Asn)/glutamyl-tRNA(Gln) amidotransferase subunit C
MPPTIDLEMARHIALLSRIEMSDEALAVFGEQLAHILQYVDKLQELNTDDVEPMAHAVEIHNVLADDEPRPSLAPDDALANAPQRDGDFFKVPKVLGDS